MRRRSLGFEHEGKPVEGFRQVSTPTGFLKNHLDCSVDTGFCRGKCGSWLSQAATWSFPSER